LGGISDHRLADLNCENIDLMSDFVEVIPFTALPSLAKVTL